MTIGTSLFGRKGALVQTTRSKILLFLVGTSVVFPRVGFLSGPQQPADRHSSHYGSSTPLIE